MHNYHIMHKAFLACTIFGSTPSILGHLLCPSQQTLHARGVLGQMILEFCVHIMCSSAHFSL